MIERFQSGEVALFLISLKAGGTGLNLTAADTVIHCDPWWNPAVEDQATDRAHRIGQSRKVTVYRLLARGTVEERIQEMKARKRGVADAVLSDDAGALRGLTQEDVGRLLGDVGGVTTEEGAPTRDAGTDDAAKRDEGEVDNADDSGGRVRGAALDALRERVHGWLKRTGSTQGSLARRAGVSPSMLSSFLLGYQQSLCADVASRLRSVVV